jgi:hypothetical protein
MKQTRLLEIIREEIAGALREETNVTVTNSKGDNDVFPFNTPADKLEIARLKKDSNIKSIKTTSGQKIKEGEKRKSLAEKYQLDEETINEMASVVQTKKALSKLVDAGLSPKENLDLVIDVEKETLDQFKNSNPSMTSDGRLIRKLKPEEITGKRDTKGYGADFEQNFKKKSGVRFDDFTADIEDKFNKAFPGEKKFNSGLATNTTEKDAAAQIFNLEKGKQGRKADPNKEEKPASTGKKGRPSGEPKAEKVATRTPGDDGFDDVSYSDVGVDDEGNKIEIDTKIQTPTGDTDIESRLNSVISAKKTKLKAAKKGSPEFEKELAALTSFLQGSEISKYVKKKIVGGSNPYSISNILKDIE